MCLLAEGYHYLRRERSTLTPCCCCAQIIQEADKIYGVAHSNRVSRIDCVTREDALVFVRANLQEAEAAHAQENGGADAMEGGED